MSFNKEYSTALLHFNTQLELLDKRIADLENANDILKDDPQKEIREMPHEIGDLADTRDGKVHCLHCGTVMKYWNYLDERRCPFCGWILNRRNWIIIK